MKAFKDDNSIPVKMWLNDIEEGALEQIKHLAQLPFAFKHIAIMPDAHQGYGMPIGGVLATEDVIIPNAVGVDIGCGMCAVKTSLEHGDLDTDTLKKIMGEIRKAVPVGFSRHEKRQAEELMPYHNMHGKFWDERPVVFDQYKLALTQIGTLGGGNHFIEIQKGNDGFIWIMIHSGSRNLGKQVADYYNRLAVKLNEKWHSKVPKEWQLAFLPVESEEGQTYIAEMNYCVEFAKANRNLMMSRIAEIFEYVIWNGTGDGTIKGTEDGEGIVTFSSPVKEGAWSYFAEYLFLNIAHNYASLENHFGKNVWVHRKGATLARQGTIGIIPGSQGSKSYIVEGLGNKESFESCSHGAGRKMGRNDAVKNLNLEEQIKLLNDKGIIHGIRNAKDLDEAPGAYKNIDEVMANQQDLVKIKVELTPLAVIKG